MPAKVPNTPNQLDAVRPPLPWFAVRVRPNAEKIVAAALRAKGYEELLPLYRARRKWSDRYQAVELPLFPGYLFCRIDLQHRLSLLTTPGLIEVVSSCRVPLPVDEAEIAAVQAVVSSGLDCEPWPRLSTGERIRIEAGPLRGLEGVVEETDGSLHILVSVSLLRRSVSVRVDRTWVYPLALEQHPAARLGSKAFRPALP